MDPFFHKKNSLESEGKNEYSSPYIQGIAMEKYQILAFYHFVPIEDPHAEVKRQKKFLQTLDAKARIYISPEGVNAQMSLRTEDAKTYLDWLTSDPRFSGINLKVDPFDEHVLPKLTVKFRKSLVALGISPDPEKGGEHVSPQKWKEMLEARDEDTLLLDVRNDYETEVGHFEGAERPDIRYFREFPDYAERLQKVKDPAKTKVMMYCTGGIRCELYSTLLKEKGFEEVYQLDGGIIRYGQEVGDSHWKGSLFVFDDRLNIPISGKEHTPISTCAHCDNLTDAYYNCANMDCNELFLSCPECAEKLQGCCGEECLGTERRRPFEQTVRPKPFRKWYNYMENKKCPVST